MKVKYLRHPIRTLAAATDMVRARLTMRSCAVNGKRRYLGDPRYNLQRVAEGFASRIDRREDDSQLLERICDAYIKATQHPQAKAEAYDATGWWAAVRQHSLQPVIRALASRDVGALQAMYENFFRDPCSAGLVNVPYSMSKAYFSKTIKDVHGHFYLSDSLHRLDHWRMKTNGGFSIHDLWGPAIGNPFGILLDDVLIRTGSTYEHYCAYRVRSALKADQPVVAEVGGGFGGMAYYLLRDMAGLTYFNFDVPESIALSSYYLLKAFPKMQIRLFGETDSTSSSSNQPRVFLMPLTELANLPSRSVDLVFSSHAMSDLNCEAMHSYLHVIDRVTRDCFFYVGNRLAVNTINQTIRRDCLSAKAVQVSTAGWNQRTCQSSRAADELECIYSFNNGWPTDVGYRPLAKAYEVHGTIASSGH